MTTKNEIKLAHFQRNFRRIFRRIIQNGQLPKEFVTDLFRSVNSFRSQPLEVDLFLGKPSAIQQKNLLPSVSTSLRHHNNPLPSIHQNKERRRRHPCSRNMSRTSYRRLFLQELKEAIQTLILVEMHMIHFTPSNSSTSSVDLLHSTNRPTTSTVVSICGWRLEILHSSTATTVPATSKPSFTPQ